MFADLAIDSTAHCNDVNSFTNCHSFGSVIVLGQREAWEAMMQREGHKAKGLASFLRNKEEGFTSSRDVWLCYFVGMTRY
ncbi:hypothetical protein L1987_46839 [Smallanthus sonchifolius]|uniref:Uncharacterized protein n=1 Tax=Smallanthus sonchifolius TaxID=185202 RepID=A0ACB9G1V0_9ASTR|nr:hypothetical protein L1987_46839 [Smallanthus sonchifolius]